MEEIIEEHGLPFSFLIALFQDYSGGVPDGDDAAVYHEALGSPDYPVVSDEAQEMLASVPYDGTSLPGKCLLSPQMEILQCELGHGHEPLIDAMVDHASGR
jgi:hypothetical protein